MAKRTAAAPRTSATKAASNKQLRIVFTGQSGIDIKESLTKFKKYADRHSKYKSIAVYKLEDIFEKVFLKENNITEEVALENIWAGKILDYPYQKLESWWSKAFKILIKNIEADEKKFKSHISLISFHSTLYHQKTSEFISCVNPKQLSTLNPDYFITLIDDIYDIYHRLRQQGKVFYNTAREFPLGWILELFVIQDWRTTEILTSRLFKKFFKTRDNKESRYCLIAVKHPFETLDNLIKSKPTAYLSHPISEVRRLEQKNETKKKAENLREELKKFTDLFLDTFTLFLPTTIDEFRIETKEYKGKKIFIPKLKPRWDADFYYNQHNNTLFSFAGFKDVDENGLWKEGAEVMDENETIEYHALLSALNSKIAKQVTIRDYMLVEQSDFLIVFRPIFNGNISGGVAKENEYHLTIQNIVERFTRRKLGYGKIFIYCPKTDILDLIREKFAFRLKFLYERSVVISLSTDLQKNEIDKNFLELAQVEKIYNYVIKSKDAGMDIADDISEIFIEIIEGRGLELVIEKARKVFEDKQEDLYLSGDTQNKPLLPTPHSKRNASKVLFFEAFNDLIKELYNYKQSSVFDPSITTAQDFFKIVNKELKKIK